MTSHSSKVYYLQGSFNIFPFLIAVEIPPLTYLDIIKNIDKNYRKSV